MAARAATIRVFCLSVCLLASPAVAQDADERHSDEQAARKSSPPAGEKKPSLAELTRVSTDETARSAAKGKAKSDTPEGAAAEPAEPAVVELQPAKQVDEASGATVASSKKSKRSPVKDVHGSVYGQVDARDAGSHREGAAVGASSKGGKASIYVETERSRQNPPPR